jgi:hypothetical protein
MLKVVDKKALLRSSFWVDQKLSQDPKIDIEMKGGQSMVRPWQ